MYDDLFKWVVSDYTCGLLNYEKLLSRSSEFVDVLASNNEEHKFNSLIKKCPTVR